MDINDINVEELRSDLIDYFGSAMIINPVTMVELSKVEKASSEEVITIALSNGFDLSNYTNTKRY